MFLVFSAKLTLFHFGAHNDEDNEDVAISSNNNSSINRDGSLQMAIFCVCVQCWVVAIPPIAITNVVNRTVVVASSNKKKIALNKEKIEKKHITTAYENCDQHPLCQHLESGTI